LFLFAVIFFLSFIHTDVYPDTKQNIYPKIDKDYSADNILGFAKYLISRNEYYRAFVELRRLDSYYPGFVKKDSISTTEFFLLFKGNRYSDIKSLTLKEASPDTKAIHLLFRTDAAFEENDFVNANAFSGTGRIAGINKDIDLFLYKRTILSYLLLNKIDDARSLIENRKRDVARLNSTELGELLQLSESCFAALKKPYNAMAFGIIPGMGYVYADKTATGIVAFLLISALSALTYYSFKTDNKPVGIFAGTAATFFYGGSIIGGYLSAKKYNDSAINDLKYSLSRKMYLAEDREEIYNNYGIGSIGK
jgi:hypothetical protein